MLYSGVIALSLALVLWFFSVRRVGNSQTAVYSNLQPVLAMVFAWLLLGEKASSSAAARGGGHLRRHLFYPPRARCGRRTGG